MYLSLGSGKRSFENRAPAAAKLSMLMVILYIKQTRPQPPSRSSAPPTGTPLGAPSGSLSAWRYCKIWHNYSYCINHISKTKMNALGNSRCVMNASGAVPLLHENDLSTRVLGRVGGSRIPFQYLQDLQYGMLYYPAFAIPPMRYANFQNRRRGIAKKNIYLHSVWKILPIWKWNLEPPTRPSKSQGRYCTNGQNWAFRIKCNTFGDMKLKNDQSSQTRSAELSRSNYLSMFSSSDVMLSSLSSLSKLLSN